MAGRGSYSGFEAFGCVNHVLRSPARTFRYSLGICKNSSQYITWNNYLSGSESPIMRGDRGIR